MTRTASILVYRTIESAGMDPDTHREKWRLVYRWTHRASNGRVVGASTQGYGDIRDLTNNLIQAHPGCWIRENGYDDKGPNAWALAWWELDILARPDSVQIPIDVPDGVKLARRNR